VCKVSVARTSSRRVCFLFYHVALLDPEDENLAFAFAKTDLRPITVYRIEAKEYLVCFNGKQKKKRKKRYQRN
jgi:hypothetical protein